MIDAKRYDTHSSEAVPVKLAFRGESLELFDANAETPLQTFPIEMLKFSERLGQMPRTIFLPDGSVCETSENDTIDAVLHDLRLEPFARLIHYVESHLRYLFISLVTTVLFTYAFIVYGLPGIATYVAFQIPSPIVYQLGAGTLTTLDKNVLQSSQLPPQRQDALRAYFSRYLEHDRAWPKVSLQFRSGKIGANALALPDGTIVMTDALVHLARNDDELLSIFFHELGHIEKRHALRTVLQDSAFILLLSAFTGDTTSIGSLLTVLPTVFVESNYSRTMEQEADEYAYIQMQKHAIAHHHFANILERLMAEQPIQEEQLFRYINSHPMTEKRIEKFRNP